MPPPARCATRRPPSGWASGRTTRAPAAPVGRPATPATRRPRRAARRRRRRPRRDRWPRRRRSPAVGEPVVERGTVGVDDVRPVDAGPRQRPNDLCGKQLPAVRIGGRQVLQVDARPAVAAADTRLAAVGAGHRTAQPQRRAEQVAHGVRHLRARTRDQLGDQLGGQLVGIGHRDVPRIGHDGLAGRIGEVQRVALVGLLKLLPVKENPVRQPVDAPAAAASSPIRSGRGRAVPPRRSRTRPCPTATRGCRRAW